MSSSPPSPALVLFARGVMARLATWETLILAVQESWGGPGAKEKRTWMAGVLVDMFEQKQSKLNSASPSTDDSYVEAEDIEDTLLQIMADEFEVHVEDGSAESLGKDIVRLWDAIMRSSTATPSAGELFVQEWETRAENTKGRKVQAHYQEVVEEDGDWEDEDGDEEDEDSDQPKDQDEAPQLINHNPGRREPEVDEDGFTVVSSRRKR
ncbi:Pre-rRNA-processing protein TSR2-domain-containing protein [Lentinula aciculospora]|uniref:Pre-rRNA-processing protein TSR2-domain-containing protein n=1 Tax=Lentinula aciculospora TaxID=153920 RepID=A0A9W9DPL2_9AGAR|nr:Pre-rRNA-processing protein TSR2-domain-containing protein [Lentinula aciculospora]